MQETEYSELSNEFKIYSIDYVRAHFQVRFTKKGG